MKQDCKDCKFLGQTELNKSKGLKIFSCLHPSVIPSVIGSTKRVIEFKVKEITSTPNWCPINKLKEQSNDLLPTQ